MDVLVSTFLKLFEYPLLKLQVLLTVLFTVSFLISAEIYRTLPVKSPVLIPGLTNDKAERLKNFVYWTGILSIGCFVASATGGTLVLMNFNHFSDLEWLIKGSLVLALLPVSWMQWGKWLFLAFAVFTLFSALVGFWVTKPDGIWQYDQGGTVDPGSCQRVVYLFERSVNVDLKTVGTKTSGPGDLLGLGRLRRQFVMKPECKDNTLEVRVSAPVEYWPFAAGGPEGSVIVPKVADNLSGVSDQAVAGTLAVTLYVEGTRLMKKVISSKSKDDWKRVQDLFQSAQEKIQKSEYNPPGLECFIANAKEYAKYRQGPTPNYLKVAESNNWCLAEAYYLLGDMRYYLAYDPENDKVREPPPIPIEGASLPKAQENLEKAIELDRHHLPAHYRRIQVLVAQKKCDEARKDFNEWRVAFSDPPGKYLSEGVVREDPGGKNLEKLVNLLCPGQ